MYVAGEIKTRHPWWGQGEKRSLYSTRNRDSSTVSHCLPLLRDVPPVTDIMSRFTCLILNTRDSQVLQIHLAIFPPNYRAANYVLITPGDSYQADFTGKTRTLSVAMPPLEYWHTAVDRFRNSLIATLR